MLKDEFERKIKKRKGGKLELARRTRSSSHETKITS
jgi:hypothetical protein